MSNNITKKLYENIYRALGGDPNVQFETAEDVWNAISDIYDEGYDPVMGARPLKRFMQTKLETLLAKQNTTLYLQEYV